MNQQIPKRSDIDPKYTWDLSSLFKDEHAVDQALEKLDQLTKKLTADYNGKMNTAEKVNQAVSLYRQIAELSMRLGSYSYLLVSVDISNSNNQKMSANITSTLAKQASEISFFESELSVLADSMIQEARQQSEENAHFLADVIRNKPHMLHPEAERILRATSPVMEAPFDIYSKAKFGDLAYEPLMMKEKTYPMSFVLYENVYEIHQDTKLRRKAFDEFSKELRKYNHTMAATYNTQLQKEKILSEQRGFASIFDFLLFDQKVDREMYDRQIDQIMQRLAKPMQKYVNLLKEVHQLDTLTFADLKIALDYNFEPEISVEASKKYIKEGLAIYGDEYASMLDRAFEERWIDFMPNEGKSSGAFCSSPYGAHPYILISWSKRMMEVFVLAHELGHAGHFYLSQQEHNILDCRPSLYFIEAPSTMNELLMSNYLMKQEANNPRFKRWVLSSMINRTYYHNFVTHLLEAHFQREVYRIIDQGGSVEAEDLNRLKRETLEAFWGDTVQINEGAELTWMRQLHYYRGLYSYTYSAGLTLATAVNERIKKDESAIEDWKKVLRAGGTKTPVELASMAGIDITDSKPLEQTIDSISQMIDEIEQLTKVIEKQ